MMGRRSACVSVAGASFGLEADPALSNGFAIDESWHAFERAPPPGGCDVRLSVRRGSLEPRDPRRLRFDSGGVWRLYDDDNSVTFQLSSPHFGGRPYKQATLDAGYTRGEIVLDEETFRDAPIYPLEYPMDEVLFTHWLSAAPDRGVEVHAAGIIDAAGPGRLFVGFSGSGKSTTARLWSSAGAGRVLSDDRIVIRDHQGGPWMFGTPWHGTAGFRTADGAPLQAVYLLSHAETDRLVRLRPAQAASRLLACAFFPFHDGGAIARTISFVDRLTARVPCWELGFRPERSVVDFVRSGSG